MAASRKAEALTELIYRLEVPISRHYRRCHGADYAR